MHFITKTSKYWFYLHPTVYISLKVNVLLYNTNSNRTLIIYDNSLFTIFESLLDISNMGVVLVDRHVVESDVIKKIIREDFGVAISWDKMPEKPSILPMMNKVNIDFDRDYKGSAYEYLLNKDVSKYLLNLSIIHNVHTNSNCAKYFMPQFGANNNRTNLVINDTTLIEILTQIEYFPISRIKIIADQIYSPYLTNIEDVIRKIRSKNKEVILSTNIKDFRYKTIHSDIQYELIIDSYLATAELENALTQSKIAVCSYCFIIKNEIEYEKAIDLIEKYGIENYRLFPYYNGTNRQFISEILTVEEKDLFIRPITMKEIYRNTKINSNLFGYMLITPDGEIYANEYSPKIGNIKERPILKCILSEIMSRSSWRHTRDFPKCQKCLFQYLCPPPISYETLLDIPDKCKAYTE